MFPLNCRGEDSGESYSYCEIPVNGSISGNEKEKDHIYYDKSGDMIDLSVVYGVYVTPPKIKQFLESFTNYPLKEIEAIVNYIISSVPKKDYSFFEKRYMRKQIECGFRMRSNQSKQKLLICVASVSAILIILFISFYFRMHLESTTGDTGLDSAVAFVMDEIGATEYEIIDATIYKTIATVGVKYGDTNASLMASYEDQWVPMTLYNQSENADSSELTLWVNQKKFNEYLSDNGLSTNSKAGTQHADPILLAVAFDESNSCTFLVSNDATLKSVSAVCIFDGSDMQKDALRFSASLYCAKTISESFEISDYSVMYTSGENVGYINYKNEKLADSKFSNEFKNAISELSSEEISGLVIWISENINKK